MFQIKLALRSFCAAHRLVKGYKGQCSHLHGHNYSINIALSGDKLDSIGMVIDFSVVKSLFNAWIDANLDHATLVCSEDSSLFEFLKHDEQKHYVLPGAKNTTAESLAEHLYSVFSTLLDESGEQACMDEVEVWETVRSAAVYRSGSTVITGSACGI